MAAVTLDIMELTLRSIQTICERGKTCDKCPFDTGGGCALNNIPEKWDLDKLYKSTKEDEK